MYLLSGEEKKATPTAITAHSIKGAPLLLKTSLIDIIEYINAVLAMKADGTFPLKDAKNLSVAMTEIRGVFALT